MQPVAFGTLKTSPRFLVFEYHDPVSKQLERGFGFFGTV